MCSLVPLRQALVRSRRWYGRVTDFVRAVSTESTSDLEYRSSRGSVMDSIYDRIKLTGQITVADYMREVLTHPTKGYYMKGDVFGRKGDYITSPEVSQVFGELIGVWLISEWIASNEKSKSQIVELGPGRGTLINDVIRTVKQFPNVIENFNFHLVEVSQAMRQIQEKTLEKSGVEVNWYENIKDVPKGRKSFFVAHEFFDALPIHQFQFVDGKWREVFVDIDTAKKEKALKFVLSRGATFSSTLYTKDLPTDDHMTRAEVCPMMLVIAEEMANRIKQDGGAALIVDYGSDRKKDFTLRGFKNHRVCDVLVDPGNCDITADVDFSMLQTVAKQQGVLHHGPMTQNEFLHKMGIRERMDALIKTSNVPAKSIISAYEMLTSDHRMGKRFKMAAMTQQGRVPVPFDIP